MDKNIVKKYKCEELTIVWEPSKCIHAGTCVHMLPEVYNPKARPWINTDNATVASLKEQISKCPSGALSYYIEGEEEAKESEETETKVTVLKNGPLMVSGKIRVCSIDGKEEVKIKSTAFCRCGHSENKPYCDGIHKQINFEG